MTRRDGGAGRPVARPWGLVSPLPQGQGQGQRLLLGALGGPLRPGRGSQLNGGHRPTKPKGTQARGCGEAGYGAASGRRLGCSSEGGHSLTPHPQRRTRTVQSRAGHGQLRGPRRGGALMQAARRQAGPGGPGGAWRAPQLRPGLRLGGGDGSLSSPGTRSSRGGGRSRRGNRGGPRAPGGEPSRSKCR